MDFFVEKRKSNKMIVAVPGSILSVIPSLREKTLTLGKIARILSIFRVDKLIVYYDNDTSKRDVRIFKEIIDYILTPPYLRKTIIKKKPLLRYVGVLNPLQIPSHIVQPELRQGEYREGIITRISDKSVHIDIGLKKPLIVRKDTGHYNLRKGEKVIVFIEKIKPLKISIKKSKNKVDVYWGFDFEVSKNILDVLTKYKRNNSLVIATSKYGKYIGEIKDTLLSTIKNKDNILILFGGPYKGLYDIFSDIGLNLEDHVDYTVNFVKKQGTKTIRTEEALPIVLSIIDFLLEQ